MNSMKHKNYFATVEYDADDEIFVGHIAGIRDIVGFHADTVPDLKAAFAESVDDYLATCKEVGKAPDKAYSGNVSLRIKPELHRMAMTVAQSEGLSLNAWCDKIMTSSLR